MKIVFRNGRAVTVDDRGYEVDVQPTSNLSATQQRIAANLAAERRMEEEVRVEADEIVAPLPLLPKEERTWFQKGAMEDGVTAGTITKAILGTTYDAGGDVLSGILGLGEKAVDAGAYLVGLLGNDDFKNRMSSFISKDLYNENEVAKKLLSNLVGASYLNNIAMTGGQFTEKDLAFAKEASETALNYMNTEMESDSVLGDKSDDLMQSAGQLAGTMGLQLVGVPWFVTSGATAFGSEVENALNEGASYGEAGASAAISAGAEILTEKLFGGSALGEKGLIAVDKLTKGIADKAIKAVADYLVDITTEGAEEVISEAISKLASALYKEENLGEILFNEEALDNYIEAFIGGSVLGSLGNAKKVSESVATNRDYRNGMTANEQKVYEAEVEKRIAKAEEGGNKLTKNEKAKIQEAVSNDLDRGGISTDTIEEVLGGNSYTNWKNTVDSEEAIKKELDTLNNIKKSDLTGAQEDRLNELKGKLEDIKKNSKRNDLKNQLGSEVMSLVQSDRLIESYNERSRRGQAYQADLSKYDEKQRATIQKAIDSKILNNTNRTHEFVDLVAKISADTGMTFDFTNNKKLQESGFAIEGKTVNGYKTKDGVTLNIESAKALNSVVGHEITHVLEGTELYSALQDAVKNYAIHKEGLDKFNARMKATEQLYKGIGDPDMELTADLVGDYLFTDADFVRNLSVQHRNVFQKIYDEIKYLCKVATAGSKEARELEQVKKKFEDAYRAAKNTTAESGVKYSLSGRTNPTYEELVAKNPIHIVDVKTGIESGSYADMKAAALKTATEGGWFDRPHHNADTDSLIFLTEKSYTHAYSNLTATFGEDTIRCMAHIPEIIENAVLVRVDDPKNPFKQETKVYTFFGAVDGVNGTEPVKLTVKEFDFTSLDSVPQNIRSYFEKNGATEQYNSLYDAHALEVVGIEGIKKEPDASGKVNEQSSQAQATSDSTISIEELLNLVKGDAEKYIPKRNYSLSSNEGNINSEYSISDSEGRQLSSEQQEYFKDSKVRDENGNLKVMYHGTPNGDFTVFKDGTYFTDNKEYADRYQNTSASSISSGKTASNPKTFEVYLDIKKPFDISDPEARNIYINEYIKGGNALGINPYLSDAEYDKIKTVDWTEGEDLRDFLIDNGYDYDGLVLDEGADGGYGDDVSYRGKSYVVFNPNQVKNIDNKAPTADPDIRYSLSNTNEQFAPIGSYNVYGKDIALVEDDIGPVKRTEQSAVNQNAVNASVDSGEQTTAKESAKPTRKQLHQTIVDNIRKTFAGKGFDFDKVLKNAKNLSTLATVDNTPQRVMEKALGYKEGQTLADLTVNKAAQNESEGIKWLNQQVKTIKEISKQYGIKPGSKQSAAAQMYAEGFYVAENNDIVKYGDAELAKDFPNAKVQQNIKMLANDPRIRRIYDETLSAINESRTRNAYPEIPRLDNYFLHFRAMEDTFSRLGLPFNPNDIRAKDLPTDLNGVTADLKPGQPYFASANHRRGKRTSFDMLGGLERYLNSAKNQIYHIDDIQTLRALRNHIAETYGQAVGLENLDTLTNEEAQERIEQIYGSHLSTFAKFLNEEANVLAGKTALIDRGLEGIIGRRGMTFMNTLNGQVGSNMVGFNISSSLTNFLPVAQTLAKTNKFDFTKAFTQTVANKLSGGKLDNFAKESPVVIRRKGVDSFYRTPWQKAGDLGYVFMSAVDDISTEIIARTKYNELTRKGMDQQKAHFETDKWVSRLMGDRSIGQQPQLYNSKMLGLVTKFQLEVRNQLDSQFYDTFKEADVSTEHIQNGVLRNATKAAKIASTLLQLAAVQHLYGTAFEKIAGYNPAFDIVEVLMTAFGYDDEEDSEDTTVDNLTQALLVLAEDLPYTSVLLDGGRIPMSSAIPDFASVLRGEDEYGNDIGFTKALTDEVKEIAPYYLMPGGYGQLKKTVAGLKMYSDEHPITGSYTDSGNLRFSVGDAPLDKVKAAIFGQYSSENAREYFDKEERTLNPDQTKILAELDVPIEEYWAYRDELNKFNALKDELYEASRADDATSVDVLKNSYIYNVSKEIDDLYKQQKEYANGTSLLKSGKIKEIQKQMEQKIADSKKALSDAYVSGYYAEIGGKRFDYNDSNGKWYEISGNYLKREQKAVNRYDITPEQYWNNTELYSKANEYFDGLYSKDGWEYVAKTVFGGNEFAPYAVELSQIKGDDLDGDGKSDNGTKKAKIFSYIDGLNISEDKKNIIKKMNYSSYDDSNYEIIEYLNSRKDLSYDERVSVLRELGFTVTDDGKISWK